MDMEKFEKWCNLQESKLWRLTFRKFIENTIFLPLILLFGLTISFTVLVSNFTDNEIIQGTSALGGFIIGLFLLSKFVIWLEALTNIEHTVCLIVKLANQISFMKEDSKETELIKILKKLNNITKFEKDEPLLFKEQAEIQNKFYQQLNELPKRVFHALKNKKICKINIEQLKKIAHYIYEDNGKKVEELESFTESYQHTSELNLLKKIGNFKLLIQNKLTLTIIWVLILIISAYGVYRLNWFSTDSIFVGFMALLGVIAYIIFKK